MLAGPSPRLHICTSETSSESTLSSVNLELGNSRTIISPSGPVPRSFYKAQVLDCTSMCENEEIIPLSPPESRFTFESRIYAPDAIDTSCGDSNEYTPLTPHASSALSSGKRRFTTPDSPSVVAIRQQAWVNCFSNFVSPSRIGNHCEDKSEWHQYDDIINQDSTLFIMYCSILACVLTYLMSVNLTKASQTVAICGIILYQKQGPKLSVIELIWWMLLTKKSKCTSKRETNIKPLLGLAYGLQTCIFGAKLLDYPSFVLRHPTEALANRAKFAHHPRRQWQVLLVLPAGRLIRPLHGSDRHSSLSRIMRW